MIKKINTELRVLSNVLLSQNTHESNNIIPRKIKHIDTDNSNGS